MTRRRRSAVAQAVSLRTGLAACAGPSPASWMMAARSPPGRPLRWLVSSRRNRSARTEPEAWPSTARLRVGGTLKASLVFSWAVTVQAGSLAVNGQAQGGRDAESVPGFPRVFVFSEGRWGGRALPAPCIPSAGPFTAWPKVCGLSPTVDRPAERPDVGGV